MGLPSCVLWGPVDTLPGACMQGCTFCGPVTDDLGVGVCMLATDACPAAEPALQAYSVGCPSGHVGMVLGSLLLYLAAFSPGVGPVPWAVNAEIYPSQVGHLPAACPGPHPYTWPQQTKIQQ